MGITARLCPFTTSCVQRFRISGVKLGNHCMLFPGNALGAAVILDFRPRLGNRCSVLAAAVKNGPPAVVVAATRSVSDSNFLCGNREWFRLQWPLRQRGPRPILFFAAARENGFAYRVLKRTQAGTGCHEGGIILSKKPPEWYLSPL